MTATAATIEYQYRTFDFAYRFKQKNDQCIGLKIYDVSEKMVFSLPNIQMPKATLSEESITKILPILVQKGILPAQYLPSAPKEDAEETPAPLPNSPPAPPPSSTATISSDSLDPQTLTRLQELSQKSKAIFDAAELTEQQSIQAVIHNPHAIHSLITSQKKEEQALGELALLRGKEQSYKYYQTFYQKFTGICLASYTIKCGMVDNAKKDTSGYISSILGLVGKNSLIPIPGLAIITGILKLKNIKNNHHAVAHLALFFADLDQSLRDIKTAARILTREREGDILTLKPQGKLTGAINAIQDWFTADESNKPVVVKAAEDCQTFLGAILAQELQPQASPEEVVSHILGRALSKPAPVAPLPPSLHVTTAASASTPLVDAASKEEFQRLEEELKAIKAERKAEKREMQEIKRKAGLAHAMTELAFGPLMDDGTQIQFQDQADPTKAKSPAHVLLHTMNRTVQEMKSRTDQNSLAIAATQEQVVHIEQRQDDLETKQKTKKK